MNLLEELENKSFRLNSKYEQQIYFMGMNASINWHRNFATEKIKAQKK